MVRLRMALISAALVSAACGTVTISEHVSTAPASVRSVAIATAEPGSFIADRGTVMTKVGVSHAQSPASAPAAAPAKEQTPATLPAVPSNPCARVGKSAPMCPVAST